LDERPHCRRLDPSPTVKGKRHIGAHSEICDRLEVEDDWPGRPAVDIADGRGEAVNPRSRDGVKVRLQRRQPAMTAGRSRFDAADRLELALDGRAESVCMLDHPCGDTGCVPF
jgi:hypothetical protein